MPNLAQGLHNAFHLGLSVDVTLSTRTARPTPVGIMNVGGSASLLLGAHQAAVSRALGQALACAASAVYARLVAR